MIGRPLAHRVTDRFQGAEQLRAFAASFHVALDFGGCAGVEFTVEIGLYARGFIACHGALLPRLSTRYPSTAPAPAPAATSPCRWELRSPGRYRGRTGPPSRAGSEPRGIPAAMSQ